MTLYNKSKRNMYLVLSSFNKYSDIFEVQKRICRKLKIDEVKFAQIVSECVERNFFDGISSLSSANNHKHNVYRDQIYITYSGYEFLKDYYGFIKKVVWNLFLIVTTAIITVAINNKFSNSNQDICRFNQISSQNCGCIKVCDNTNN